MIVRPRPDQMREWLPAHTRARTHRTSPLSDVTPRELPPRRFPFISRLTIHESRVAERDTFESYDKQHHIRSTLVDKLKKEFAEYSLTYSIGGQISFDVFPTGSSSPLP